MILSNELERELLTSATAMCLWQEWMIWYQGERTMAFTDAFGMIGPVSVRGQTVQRRIASRLRSIPRRLRIELTERSKVTKFPLGQIARGGRPTARLEGGLRIP